MVDTTEVMGFGVGDSDLAPLTLAESLPEDETRRQVADAMTEGVVVQEASGEIVWFNPAACRLLSLTAKQLLGEEPTDLNRRIVHLDGSRVRRDHQPAMVTLRTGLPVRNMTVGVRTRKDNTVWLSVSSRLAHRAGTPIAITTFTDVTGELTSRRELEETVRDIGASVLQNDLPTTDRVHVAAKTEAAGPDPHFSGHFYGAHHVGRDRIGFFLGDVEGHGTQAACVAALARHTLRSAGTLLDDPDAVLHHLHDAVAAEWPGTALSAVYGYVDVRGDDAALRLSNGGHTVPLLISGLGISQVGVAGATIGTGENEGRPPVSFVPYPHDHLLLYTSGIVGHGDSTVDDLEFFAPIDTSMSTVELVEAACDLASGVDDGGSRGEASVLVIGIV